MTFLMGFYIIPHFGLTGPAVATGILLAVLPMISLFRKAEKEVVMGIIALAGGSMLSFSSKPNILRNIRFCISQKGFWVR